MVLIITPPFESMPLKIKPKFKTTIIHVNILVCFCRLITKFLRPKPHYNGFMQTPKFKFYLLSLHDIWRKTFLFS